MLPKIIHRFKIYFNSNHSNDCSFMYKNTLVLNLNDHLHDLLLVLAKIQVGPFRLLFDENYHWHDLLVIDVLEHFSLLFVRNGMIYSFGPGFRLNTSHYFSAPRITIGTI